MNYTQTTPCKDCPFLKRFSHAFKIERLALKILDGLTPDNMDIYIEESGEPFNIDLTDDGSLIISNYETMINNIPVIFKTTYNSKANYPFFCEVDYTDYEVFDDNGNFTDEFKNLSL